MNTINLFQASTGMDIAIPFPAAWNELHQPELEIVASELINPHKDDPATGRVNIFMNLIAYRIKQAGIKLKKGWQTTLNVDDLSTQGLDAINFLFHANELTFTPAIKIKYGLWGHTFHGPEADFKNITAGEYEDAGVFAHAFSKDPNIEHLQMMTAILWRPKGMPYDENPSSPWFVSPRTIPERLKLVKKLPPHVLYTVMIWFTGCSGILKKFFPLVYATGGSDDKDEGDIMAFTKCIHAGAGPRNGTRDQVRRTLLLEFLLDMQLEMEANKKMKEEMERNK